MNPETMAKVKKCIAEVLARNPEEINERNRLIEDLGADSLDLVELMYLLEQEFSIRLDKNDLSLSVQLGLPEEEIHKNELLTPKALALLNERYPQASNFLVEGITRKDLAALLTVDEVARAVDRKKISSLTT